MAYALETSQVPGGNWLPAPDDPWWREALGWVGRLFHGEYPKPLPPPLPFTAEQVRAMLLAVPAVRSAIRTAVEGQGHTHLFLGHDPSSAELGDPSTLAALALWFADGTGDDLSRGEDEIRTLLIGGMRQLAAGGQPGGTRPPSSSSGGGGGGGLPTYAAPPSSSIMPALLAVGLLGAVVFAHRRA